MQARCPLCLSPLDRTSRFLRFCTLHPPAGGVAREIRYDPADPGQLLKSIRCPARGCKANGGTGIPGVFLAHVGCVQGLDPFVDEAGTPVPSAGAKAVHPVTEKLEKVGHWQMGLHRQIEETLTAPRPREAFFPTMLLRSTLEEPDGSGKRHGALVGLIGSQGVGKTVLAMQALDAQGYSGGDTVPGVGTRRGDYLYCSPEPAGGSQVADTYLKTLRMRELMANNSAFLGWVKFTPVMPRNVKAVFFDPAPAPAAPPKEAKSGFFGQLLGELDQVGSALGTLAGANGARDSWLWTVAFYDLAGESTVAAADRHVTALGANVDVLAVVLSWEELTGSASTLGTASARLKEALEWKRVRGGKDVRCAVVVTKADLAAGKQAALFTRIQGGPRSRDRNLLRGSFASIGTPSTLATLRELDVQLAGPGVDDVFFLWTEDLEGSAPRSVGLEDFVSWCVLGRRVP